MAPPAPIYAVLGVTVLFVAVALLVRARQRAATAAESDSDDEAAGSLGVRVVSEPQEQDSLLPAFSSLLRSPWLGQGGTEQPQKMRPVKRGLSLTIPLPLRKKRAREVPTKKLHTPYFFPLLDETAQWWETQQDATEQPQYEPETAEQASSAQRCKEDAQTKFIPELLPTESRQFAAAIEVGGR